MKLKKSLLALTTAATVAVAGSTAAVADDANTGANSSNTGITNSLSRNKNEAEDQASTEGEDKGDDNPDKGGDNNKPSKLATSSANFFGWTEKTEGLQKFKDVTALVTAVGALVAGIVTLANNFQKLGKLFK